MHISLQKVECPICHFQISRVNFNRHKANCDGLGPQTKRERKYKRKSFVKMFTPEFCKTVQEYYDNGDTVAQVLKNFNFNCRAWNKAVKLNLLKSRDRVVTQKNNILKLTLEERKKRFSRKQELWHKPKGGYRPNAGHSQKFYVTDSYNNNVCLQSSYEKICSDILNELKIKWIRPKALIYNNKKYFPDFYLTDYNVYLDPKNDFLYNKDLEKINNVIKENKVKIFILKKENLNKEFILSLCNSKEEYPIDNRNT
jgi:hypothetical protein